jgi:putative GTP pyrophosphokinase
MASESDPAVEKYQEIRPVYVSFVDKIRVLLGDLLDASGIKYHVIEGRAKTVNGFAEKIRREGKSYKDPLNEITDLAGVRLILYYGPDVDRVCELLDREFIVDQSRSIDKRSSLAVDEFGYLSVHKIISLSPGRAQLPEWSAVRHLVAEIQVRTVLQHAWAAISHSLQYNREADIPYALRRRLVRVSGLLELADQEFDSVRREQGALIEEVSRRADEGDYSIAVDALTISKFEDSAHVHVVSSVARKSGLHVVTSDRDRGVSQLVAVCGLLGIEDIAQLRSSVEVASRQAAQYFAMFRRKHSTKSVSGTVAHYLAMLLAARGWQTLKVKDLRRVTSWDETYVHDILEGGKAIFK